MKRNIPTNWPKHKPREVTGAQIKAVQAAYSALKRADDPRVYIGVHGVGKTDREQRLRWAWHKLGREITTFSELTLKEAEYLLDLMNDEGGVTKLDQKITEEMQRLNVRNQEAFFESFCKPRERYSKNQWSFGGRTLSQLNRADKIALVSILVNREPAKESHAHEQSR